MQVKMDNSAHTHKMVGSYLGTEIDEKWWKRYSRDKFLARGKGEYWHDDQGFYFLRYLTKKPLFIPFSAIAGFRTGTWHAGQWSLGYPILKMIWTKDDTLLSSGFFFTKQHDDITRLIGELKDKMSNNKN
jgi:hypothetical protein